MKLLHISFGGPDRKITDADGKAWTFEDHPQFGPIVLNARGDPAASQPGSRSAFWPAWKAWSDGGKRLQADCATCIWEPAQPDRVQLVHLGGRNYALAGSALAKRMGKA
jgi:hypothetical protein